MRNRITPTAVLAGSALAAALALTGCTTGDTGASPSPTATAGENGTATAGTAPSTSASPGATGTPTGTASTAEANRADHRFARMMIPHHEQAIEMSDIILGKQGLDPEVATLAEEIKAAQGPEIEQMESWLEEWGVGRDGMGPNGDGMGPNGDGMGPNGDGMGPNGDGMGPNGDGMGPNGDGPMGPGSRGPGSMGPGQRGEDRRSEGPMGDGERGGMMDGMLSQEELRDLEQAGTEEAARLYLEGMIGHHEGAIDMAEDEVRNGQYPDAVALAETIIETQQREIETMRELLGR